MVEFDDTGLKQWPEVDLNATLPEAARRWGFGPMAVSNGKLASLAEVAQGVELRVIPLEAGVDNSSGSSLLFQLSEGPQGELARTCFQGAVAVLPDTAVTDDSPIREAADNSQNAHAVVNESAEGGAVVIQQCVDGVAVLSGLREQAGLTEQARWSAGTQLSGKP